MNIKQLRAQHSLSQQQLADKTGIPRSRIAKWEEGKGNPKTEDHKTLENFFKKIGEKVPRETSYTEKRRDLKNNKPLTSIPVYESAPITMGEVTQYRDEQHSDPDFWITIPQLKDCDYATRAKGSSMAPMIRSGSLVIGKQLFDPSVIVYGEIYIVHTINGLETIKYVNAHPEKEDHVILEPYNPKAGKTPIKKDEILKIFEYRACFQFP